MAGILASQIADLVKITRTHYPEDLSFSNIALDSQELHTLNMFRQNAEMNGTGTGDTWDVMTDTLHNAHAAKLFETDTADDNDQFAQATLTWRHLVGAYPIEAHLLNMNSGSEAIVKYIQAKRVGGLLDVAQRFEDYFWGKRPASDDSVTPLGVWYWIVKNVTSTDYAGNISDGTGLGGFNGGNPWSGVYPGGLNDSHWKNFTNLYTDVSETDFSKKLRAAAAKCNFKSPIPFNDAVKGPPRWQFYCGLQLRMDIVQRQRAANDNLGFDINNGVDQVAFMGRPVNWVPALDADTDVPFVGLDWATFIPRFLTGFFMTENTVTGGTQHNVTKTFIDSSYLLKCTDRRRQFVLSKAASY